MVIKWYKTSYLLITLLSTTVGYGAERDVMIVETAKKRSRDVAEDQEPFCPSKRQKLKDEKDHRKREIQIERICHELISPLQKKQIHLDELFPNQDFSTFTAHELQAYLLVWPKESPISEHYVTEVIQRAKLGHCDAQNNLGLMYSSGKGVTQDKAMATHWFEKAAKQGYIPAQNNLGDSYYFGQGVLQDYKIAVRLFKRAAKQGYALAQSNLGDMYYLGYGVEQNYSKAAEWYEKAALQGYVEAYNGLGDVYYLGKNLRDYPKAFHWHRKASQQNHIASQKRLGDMYSLGHGVAKDSVQAFQWYEKAALQDDPQAQNQIGYMYDHGLGVPQDSAQAFQWYEKAALQGYAVAQYNLGYMYDNGQGVPKDVAQAIQWYAKAAVQGEKSAQQNFRSFFVGVGGRESVMELSMDIAEHRDALVDNLVHLKDYYYFYAGFSGGKLKDNFGGNPQLLALSNYIINQIEYYQSLLDDQIFKPAYAVDCLSLKPSIEKTKEFTITLPDPSKPGISKEFASMFSLETLEAISTGRLALAVTKFTEMVENAYLLLKEMGQKPDQLKGALLGLKYANNELATLLAGFTQRFLAAREAEAANEEFMLILKHLEDLHKTLQAHRAFTAQLNHEVYSLMIQTLPYRNHLTKQNYPFLFR